MDSSQNAFGGPDYGDYWSCLGQFLHEFAGVERTVQHLLWRFAGVSEQIGRAAFSGLRADAAKDAINRILDATENVAAKTRLAIPFNQLGLINGVRNNIVHWGAKYDGTDLLVTNRFLAASPDRVREFRISPTTLVDMTSDLAKIDLHIGLELIEGDVFEYSNSEVWKKLIQPKLDGPWLYIPTPQSPPKKERQPSARKQSRQPSASPG